MIKVIHPGRILILTLAMMSFFLVSCANQMDDQPKYEPLEVSEFFPDERSARTLVEHTIARDAFIEDQSIASGRSEDGDLVEDIPLEITMELLEEGRKNYDVYCSPCHGFDGFGEGMIVRRGFSAPPSFHAERLQQAPAGHFFEVITNGFGQMFSYAYRIPVRDRWAVVAYIRALQLSQNASPEDVPSEQLPQMQRGD
jgi:mono/diheme cytochrome c family protein